MIAWLRRRHRAILAAGMAAVLVAGVAVAMRIGDRADRIVVVGFFDNSTGLYPGDDVRIRGVRVGEVTAIEPQPLRTKITFWVDRRHRVPADANAVILAPQLVTGRAVALTPPYSGGPVMTSGTVIPQERTAVPVEWDDVRAQLERLTAMLQPTEPGGVSTLGALINTAADNLRGQGGDIRATVVELSRAVSILGDRSDDVFGTIRNLSTLVTALQGSSDLLGEVNVNLAAVSGLLADDPGKIGEAIEDLNGVIGEVRQFVAENRQPVGTASEKLGSITAAVTESLDDLQQTLHVLPTVAANFNNIYEPANGSLTGELMINNFANPLAFLCGAIQAASRMGAEHSAKLCVQYLAPIVKNRQYNFLPLGENFFVGAQARPNEVTYSEEWMRPDYVPPAGADPAAGLSGLMMPPGGGS